MNEPERRVAERRMDIGLAVVLGGEAVPDVSARVRAALDRPPRRTLLPTAALVMIGLAAMFAIAVSGEDPAPLRAAPTAPTQDPGRGPLVRTAAEIERLPADARAVRGLRLDKSGCRALQRLTHLEELTLTGFSPEDEPLRDYTLPAGALDVVGGLRELRTLSLEVLSSLEPGDLAALLRLPQLTALRLWRVDELEDAHIAACQRLPALRKLHVEGTGRVSDASMRVLAELTSLTELRVRGVLDISSEGYRQLASLRNLRVLDLGAPWYLWETNGSKIVYNDEKIPPGVLVLDDGVLAELASLEQLRVLELEARHGLTDEGLAQLASLKHLEKLNLTECGGITDAGLAQLPASLRTLTLNDCYKSGARFPLHLQQLEKLVARDVPLMSDASVATIAGIPGLRHNSS